MEYQVILDDFQGPLDLLLHLIKETISYYRSIFTIYTYDGIITT